MLTIRKECRFEAAHLLNGHPGECRNLHGHTYRVVVEVAQRPDQDEDMVMDFKDLKAVLREVVLDRFDHAFLYDQRAPAECEIAAVLSRRALRAVPLPFRTTAENLARHIFKALETHIAVTAVTVYETPESCAEFRRSAPPETNRQDGSSRAVHPAPAVTDARPSPKLRRGMHKVGMRQAGESRPCGGY